MGCPPASHSIHHSSRKAGQEIVPACAPSLHFYRMGDQVAFIVPKEYIYKS